MQLNCLTNIMYVHLLIVTVGPVQVMAEQMGDWAYLRGVIRRVQQSEWLHNHSQWHGALLQQVITVRHHAERTSHEAWVGIASVPHNEAGLSGGGVGVLVARRAVLLRSFALGGRARHLSGVNLGGR